MNSLPILLAEATSWPDVALLAVGLLGMAAIMWSINR